MRFMTQVWNALPYCPLEALGARNLEYEIKVYILCANGDVTEPLMIIILRYFMKLNAKHSADGAFHASGLECQPHSPLEAHEYEKKASI